MSPVSPGAFSLTEADPGGGPLTNPDNSLVTEPSAIVGNLKSSGGLTANTTDGPILVAATPQRATPGSTVELFGMNLGTAAGTVSFGSAVAAVVSWTDGRVQVVLPGINAPVDV